MVEFKPTERGFMRAVPESEKALNTLFIGVVSLFLLFLGGFMGLLAMAQSNLLAGMISVVAIVSALIAMQEADDIIANRRARKNAPTR